MLKIVVLGDANADWLAYGLEDAYSENPEINIVRKHRRARQIRRLRTGDGVYFNKFGARKLAHYVEREVQRHQISPTVLLTSRRAGRLSFL